jgi:MazG family protein
MTETPFPEREKAAEAFLALLDVMTTLRAPGGCDWDRAQDLKTLRPYLLEEAHEVLDILDDLGPDGSGPRSEEHRDELGDLLLQIVFQAELQREQGRFDVADVCDAVRAKLERRHPHIFGDADKPPSWEAIRAAERADHGERHKSALDGVPRELPALLRALRVGEKAHAVGFDWPDHTGVLDKIEEELGEVREAIANESPERVADEIGDVLYALVNLSRHMGVDPEAALRGTISKFEDRWRHVEGQLTAKGKTPHGMELDELEAHWQQAKEALASDDES